MAPNNKSPRIGEANQILRALGMPRAQQNERSALCLLALLNLSPRKSWEQAESPLVGITPIMDWAKEHYNTDYAPNTRETFRRQTMHQLVDAGIVLRNPDKPSRPVNSPQTVYRIAPEALALLQAYGRPTWPKLLKLYLSKRKTLAAQYAKERQQSMIPVSIAEGKTIRISPGEHSKLIAQIIQNFAPRFVPGGTLVYVGDTGEKWGYFDDKQLKKLGISIDSHGKMPDVVIYFAEKNWLILVEAVTSHGPVDGKRHAELAKLFADSTAGLVYVTAFPSRQIMARYVTEIAWETEVWAADSPSHLMHFNGSRFLGPYADSNCDKKI